MTPVASAAPAVQASRALTAALAPQRITSHVAAVASNLTRPSSANSRRVPASAGPPISATGFSAAPSTPQQYGGVVPVVAIRPPPMMANNGYGNGGANVTQAARTSWSTPQQTVQQAVQRRA